MGKFNKTGAVALAFLVVGYQAALFVNQLGDNNDTAAVETVADTVSYSRAKRKVESFEFNPNTVSLEDLKRLGFSEKQAQSILNYRLKGGRFHRKEDFAKSFVVADSVYKRLEAFIIIPSIDINAADSAMLDQLPGIGPYYVKKILDYREELGRFSRIEELLEIEGFGDERYNNLKDLIHIGD